LSDITTAEYKKARIIKEDCREEDEEEYCNYESALDHSETKHFEIANTAEEESKC